MALEEEILQTHLGSVRKNAGLMEDKERATGCYRARQEVEVGVKRAGVEGKR